MKLKERRVCFVIFTLSVFNMVSIAPINRLLLDMSVYINPQYLNKSSSVKIDTGKIDISMLNKYYSLISSINWIFNKILKYELYFKEFYPSSPNIPNYEALEHNVHSYIQDLVTLKEKLRVFLDVLKNDIKKVATNKDEIVNKINDLIKKLNKIFSGVTIHRNPHCHQWWKFLDEDIVDSEWLSAMLKFSESFSLPFNSDTILQIKKRTQESFEKAREKRINQAQKNSEWMTKLIDGLFSDLEKSIYKLLWMKQSLKEFIVPSPK